MAAAAVLLTVAPYANAQDLPNGQRKRAQAVRIQGRSLHLDGRLDESAWQSAHWIDDFLQKDPKEGAPCGERTEVGILYDSDALWIGARMSSNNPNDIRLLMSRHDKPGNTERIIVSLDTYGDRRTAYSFSVSVAGVRSEYYHPVDDEYTRDHTYNPVWDAHTAIDSAGWTTEIRIPFSQLRFNDAPSQRWGLNLNRWVPARNEDDFWIYTPKNGTGWASHFGDLEGIEGIKPSRRLELLPYVASDGNFRDNVDPADPFRDSAEFSGRAGSDLKMGLGPNLTLDGTVNPDFGQVEADPAEVNLTAFETFFDERRPFFTEGSQLLNGNGANYFYSRRIGAAPPGVANGDFVDFPRTSTILGAAKVTGRLANGASLGVLSALTDREFAKVSTGGVHDRIKVAPRTGYGVLRAQQEFGASKSTVGLSWTGVSRDLRAGDALADRVTRHAYSGGGDWLLRFKGGEYEFGGYAGFSWVEGSPAAIARVQTASARYFQRPDAGHVKFDPTRTSLGGWTANIRGARRSGTHWLWSGSTVFESPGLELNDAGRLSSADDIDQSFNLRYRNTKPGRMTRDYEFGLVAQNDFNFGGARKRTYGEFDADVTWPNFVHTSAYAGYSIRALNDDQTRGGPLFLYPRILNLGGSVNGNFASTRQWNVYTNGAHNEIGSYDWQIGASLSGRLGDRWELSVAPFYDHGATGRQFIARRDNGPAAAFGQRIIFARLDRSTVSAQVRATYGFNQDLTLEAYAEPFVATGRFARFGELRAARTNALRYYGTDGTTFDRDADGNITITDGADTIFLASGGDYLGDFRSLSFRSNMVLRWEWRAGSTFFLIWQNDRSQFGQSRRLARAGDLWDALSASGDDVLAAKLTYWLPVD